MSTQVIPPGGFVLHNTPTKTIRDGSQSASAQAVAVCKLNNELVKELQQLARNSKGFTLLTGKTLVWNHLVILRYLIPANSLLSNCHCRN